MPLPPFRRTAAATSCAVACVVAVATPYAQAEGHHAAAVRRAGSISVDGKLDEQVWKSAPAQRGFWQRYPAEGKPPSHDSEFRVVYDDTAIYIGVRAMDAEPHKIKQLLTRRDEMSPSDWILVGIDSYHDKRTAFVFGINAANVQRDWLIYDDGPEDASWDAVWTASARVDAYGWCAEFRIPLSQLRFSGQPEQQWGLQIGRVVGRTGEQTYWSPMPKGENRAVSLFGTLEGIHGVKPGRRLELLPYVTGGGAFGTVDGDNPFDKSASPRGNAGVDVRYGLGSAFTLAASINPDFGQVEADPSQVNLSANELFFPEKRPFFLEGVDIFKFGLGSGDENMEALFYSRRIGAAPHNYPDGDFVDVPKETTIYGATKISGKASGWSLGVLEAVTAEENASVDIAGERHEEVVEPLTNYGLARVKRDFRDGGTQVGAIATAVNRKLSDTPLDALLHDQAYTGGANVNHRFGGQAWNMSAKLTGTYVHGSPEAIEETQRLVRHLYQRPDAHHLELDPTRTSLAGGALVWDLGRNGSTKHWRFATGGDYRTPGYEANDMGFQQGADQLLQWGWAQYREDTPGDTWLQYNANVNAWAYGDTSVQYQGWGGNVNGWGQDNDHWSINGGFNWDLPAWNVQALRGGPALRAEPSINLWSNLNSDDRKPVRGSLSARWWRQWASDSWRGGLSAGVTIQARPNIDVFLGPSVDVNVDDQQYVEEAVDDAGMSHFVFARIRQVVTSMTVRGSWTFSPRLSLQVYAQPFIASGDYQRYSEADNPDAAHYADRFHELYPQELTIDRDEGVGFVDRNYDGTPDYAFSLADFNVRELRSNVVLRWEYLPGSTMFLIWSHGQSDFIENGSYRLGAGLSDLLRAPSEDVVMLKVNYWVGL